MATAFEPLPLPELVFEFGAFRVEVAERRLLHQGTPISVAPKVFETLIALLANAGHLVTKESLIARVWAARVVEEAAVAKTMFMLRKVLADSGDAPRYIETVPKAGYRFIAPVRVSKRAVGSPATPGIALRSVASSEGVARRSFPVVRIASTSIAAALAALLLIRPGSAVREHEFARAVTSQVGTPSGARNTLQAAKQGDIGPDSYQNYLRARYMLARRTSASIERAIALLQQVNSNAPRFAPAWATLADCYVVRSMYSAAPDGPALERADGAATRALALDPSLGEAYAARAYANFFRWNFAAAERDFRRSIAFDPDNLAAHQWYAEYLRFMGREAEAIEQSGLALKIDPLSLIVNVEAALPHYYLGDYERAARQLQRTIELDPAFASAHGHLALVYDAEGRHGEALAEILLARRFDQASWIEAELGIIQAHLGHTREAQWILDRLLADPAARGSVSASVAELEVALGDRSAALRTLEEGAAMHSSQLVGIAVDPRLATLRGEPRFTDLVRRLGLPARAN